MKTISILSLLLFVLASAQTLFAVIHETDQQINDNIINYMPIYAKHTNVKLPNPTKDRSENDEVDDGLDALSGDLYAMLKVESPVEIDPKPWSTASLSYSFLDYTNEATTLQLYKSLYFLRNIEMNSEAAGEPIPLEEGDHERIITNEIITGIFSEPTLINYLVVVKIRKSELAVLIKSSGKIWNKYENAPVWTVDIELKSITHTH